MLRYFFPASVLYKSIPLTQNERNVLLGLPQGSVLSALFCSIFLNDINNGVSFGDDGTIGVNGFDLS